MENIKNKAITELKGFLDRSGEKLETFVAKVQVFEDVLTVDFEAGTSVSKNELSIILLAKTPQGLQVAYNNVVSYASTATEEEIFKDIETAFPTQEDIDAAKAKAAEEANSRKEFEEKMQNMNPQQIAEMMSKEGVLPEAGAAEEVIVEEEVVTETK